MAFRNTSEIIPKVLGKGKLAAGYRRGQVLTWWASMVGRDLATITQAERLEDKILYIKVHDSVVAHQLTYMRDGFLKKIAEKFPKMVLEIRFTVGRIDDPYVDPPLPPETEPLTPEEEERAAQIIADIPEIDEDLKPAVLGAARAFVHYQNKLEGKPCAICGVVADGSPCSSCVRTFEHPAVVNEAKRLVSFPLRPRLEGEALLCAKHLAERKLKEQVDELLLMVIQEPLLLPALEDCSRRLLQLRTGKEIVTEAFGSLSPSLQSLLKTL